MDTHIKAAIVAVTEMAGDVNEHLSKRRQKAKKAREKRDAEVLPSEDEAMRETEERVREMTEKAEEHIRGLIDLREEVGHKEWVLKNWDSLLSEDARMIGADEGQDGEDTVAAPSRAMAGQLTERRAKWGEKSMRDRLVGVIQVLR